GPPLPAALHDHVRRGDGQLLGPILGTCHRGIARQQVAPPAALRADHVGKLAVGASRRHRADLRSRTPASAAGPVDSLNRVSAWETGLQAIQPEAPATDPAESFRLRYKDGSTAFTISSTFALPPRNSLMRSACSRGRWTRLL